MVDLMFTEMAYISEASLERLVFTAGNPSQHGGWRKIHKAIQNSRMHFKTLSCNCKAEKSLIMFKLELSLVFQVFQFHVFFHIMLASNN